MREIKFRGMTLNGKWVYGLVSHITKSPDPTEPGWYICNSVGRPLAYAVRPDTIGQWTGHGDIYEGDIVAIDASAIRGYVGMAEVMWVDDYTLQENPGWGFWVPHGGFLPHGASFLGVTKILGNIYQNQELLE